MRRFFAARVAARLAGPDTKVEMRRGRLGELRVTVDGREAFRGSRVLWTLPGRAVRAVLVALEGPRPPHGPGGSQDTVRRRS